MNFTLRWEPACEHELVAIYGDLQTADAAICAMDWQLSRDPIRYSWELEAGSPIRLAWVKPYLEFPAVYLSFELLDAEGICLMQHARRANVSALS